jgi:hypothetical protein
MKFARFWPLAAVAPVVGLIYVVFAQADAKSPPAQQLPQPVEAVFEDAEAPFSPSDLPRLGVVLDACKSENACTSGTCKLGIKVSPVSAEACDAACADVCKSECTVACKSECKAACKSNCTEVACESKCGDCQSNCTAACENACSSEFIAKVKPCAVIDADCACGTNCACAKECACGDKCKCREKARNVSIAGECECGPDCACPGAGACHCENVAEWMPAPPRFYAAGPYSDPGCADHVLRTGPPIHVWAPPPPPAYAFTAPVPAPFAPPPPPEVHHGMHEQLVHAMTETARLHARDEAWAELQKRDRALAELAVQNARLQAQVELAAHKEKSFEHAAALLAKNAALEAKLEAFDEKQELVEALMEVTAENARLEAATELLEVQHEIHAEALGAMVETRQELLAPLHEALVENASLKAHAASSEESTHLKTRIAELEKAIAKAEKQAGKIAAPVKTAKKAETAPDSETK